MHNLLLPGARLKRWLLMLFSGVTFLLFFLLITFGDEMESLLSTVSLQFYRLFLFRPEDYSLKFVLEISLFAVGIVFVFIGARKLMDYFVTTFVPEKRGRIFDTIAQRAERQSGPKVVVIGGGTGSYTILKGLKKYTEHITAIVSMFDSGGSTGRLRDEFGYLPPGDVRRCLLALAPEGSDNLTLRQLLDYRFSKGKGLQGHNFGNLLLTALKDITHGELEAINACARILNLQGKVLPVTLQNSHLCAQMEDGKIVKGETNIDIPKHDPNLRIRKLFLSPQVKALPESLKAIKEADMIVIGPGDLYTSIIPNLLAAGITTAIKASSAKKVYVCNVMTKPGETTDFTAEDHVSEIMRYLGTGVLDHVIVNSARAPEEEYRKYKKSGAKRVKYDENALKLMGVEVVAVNLLAAKDLLRHDSDKLARTVIGLA
ncbi:MAG TPA: gluconeogenesis factor YvcK family protein [Candidatus Nanoarchaeia archaeon]|nr:gluconeogenesis factor YvcK family protein [Candidatus Nanoarchaeia archaeon]